MLHQNDLKWIAKTSTELNTVLQQIARYADLMKRHKGDDYIDQLNQQVEIATQSAQALFNRVTSKILENTRPGSPNGPAATSAAPAPELLAGARFHALHVSTAGSVELIRRAKAEGLPVTAEATPHHLTLTDAALCDYDTNFKVNPPLRSASDVEALRAGLADGTIDAIATDHAPHAAHEKEAEFEAAPPGLIGLETALGVVVTDLLDTGALTLQQLVTRMSTAPARILGLEGQGGPLVPGARANLVVFDPAARWRVDPATFASRSRNCPWAGRELAGRVLVTIFDGRVVVRGGEVLAGAPTGSRIGATA